MYNPTHGLFTDCLIETRAIVQGSSTTPCITLRKEMQKHLASSPQAFVKLIPHSQGCAIAYNSIMKLSQNEKSRIDALFVAPAKVMPSGIIRNRENIANRFDMVPRYFNTPGERRQNIKYVSWKWDHYFQSKTFEESLRKFINE